MIMNKNPDWGRYRRRKIVTGRGVRPSRNLELRYGRVLRNAFDLALIDRSRQLADAYERGIDPDRIAEIADSLQVEMADVLARLGRSAVPEWFMAIDDYTRLGFEKSLHDALGIDAVSLLDGRVFGRLRDEAISENVFLIRSEARHHVGGIMQAIMDDYRGTGFPDESKSLAGRIQAISGITREHASVIARDQTAKLNSRLVQARQEDAGITHYIWRTAGDNRVVGQPGGLYPKGNTAHGNHYERNGKVFRWDRPPDDGHPGEAILCRCVALPVLNPAKLNLADPERKYRMAEVA